MWGGERVERSFRLFHVTQPGDLLGAATPSPLYSIVRSHSFRSPSAGVGDLSRMENTRNEKRGSSSSSSPESNVTGTRALRSSLPPPLRHNLSCARGRNKNTSNRVDCERLRPGTKSKPLPARLSPRNTELLPPKIRRRPTTARIIIIIILANDVNVAKNPRMFSAAVNVFAPLGNIVLLMTIFSFGGMSDCSH